MPKVVKPINSVATIGILITPSFLIQVYLLSLNTK